MKKKLYLITGFLGSGKTTLMKKLLEPKSNTRTGVIVNEFGKENVDSVTLSQNEITITEISNGSIFCSCRSDLFIDALIELGNSQLDNVFIETSGMSNPWSMPEVINIANSKTNNAYEYMGCLTIVDCNTFMKLSNMVNAINKQIAFADYILLNKSDLVTDTEKEKIKSTIEVINSNAAIEFTTYCDVYDLDKLLSIETILYKGKEEFSLASQSGVRKVLFEFTNNTDYDNFTKFINIISKETYRIKGFVTLNNLNYAIDCVNTQISIKQTKIKSASNYIVLIADSSKPLKMTSSKYYEEIFKEKPNVKE